MNDLKIFKDVKKIVFLSRNNSMYGYKVLKTLIRLKKKPYLILLPQKPKKNFRLEMYVKKIFNLDSPMEAVEHLASLNKIKVKRIKTINSEIIKKKLKKEKFDILFISGGWPELINKKIYSVPKYNAINIHPSYLPNFRGGDVHRWQIYSKSRFTGVSIHFVDDKFDNGLIITKKRIPLKTKNPIKLNIQLSSIASKIVKKLFTQNITNKIDTNDFVKNYKYYKKWNWHDSKFFFIKKNNYHNLECFVNSSFNIPNNFNCPYIKIANKIIFIRSCFIKSKMLKPFKGDFYATKNYLILKTIKKNMFCYVDKIQFAENYKWNKNEVKSKLIYNNFHKYF